MEAICEDCLGSIGSLVELLQGKLSKNVMERVCREGDGLFPGPGEIKMSCSCLDWAGMCKHVAAALYGAGARLDAAPDLLFTLRGVDRTELIAGAGADLSMTRTGAAPERVLADDDVAALFGSSGAASGGQEKEGAIPGRDAPAKCKIFERPAERKIAGASKSTDKKTGGGDFAERAACCPGDRETTKESRRWYKQLRGPNRARRGRAARKHHSRSHKNAEKDAFPARSARAETEAKSRRQNRTKAARWIGVRARKTRG